MPHINKDHNMPYIVNGNTVSRVSDAEFETIKKHEIDKFNKQSIPWEILFVVVISLSIILLISYGVYDVIHSGYTPTCVCH